MNQEAFFYKDVRVKKMQFPELEGNNYGKDVMLKMHDDKLQE